MNDVTTRAEDVLAEVRDLVRRAQESQGDTEALMALHAPEAVVVNVVGRRVLGRDALEAAMRQAMASSLARVTTTTEVDDVRLLGPGLAIVSCTKTIHDGRAVSEGGGGQGAVPASGRLTYVLVREGGEWRIALAQTTPIA